jgi:LacI family transcriptional regulator
MQDVARKAGVSQTTVSLVLNDLRTGNISDITRERVYDAARELNYTVKKKADPRGNTLKVLGVVVPTLSNLIYPLWIQEIEEYAGSKGYKVLLCNTSRNPENEIAYLTLLLDVKVDGIIFIFNPTYPDFVKKVERQVPFINLAEKTDHLNVSIVGLDSVKAGEVITNHLLELGHRHFAYITTPIDSISISRAKRLEGIRAKLKQHHLEKNLIVQTGVNEHEPLNSAYEIEIGYSLTLQLLKSHPVVTAIIGVNDMVAVGIMNAIKEQGFEVPRDFSVCGFDNIVLARIFRPGLTTIEHHTYYRAKHAVDILIDKINKTEPRETVLKVEYEPQLVVRESTGRPRGENG